MWMLSSHPWSEVWRCRSRPEAADGLLSAHLNSSPGREWRAAAGRIPSMTGETSCFHSLQLSSGIGRVS
ncbi:hypothetical protein PsYK624_153470 [Phanerochaete sordida]|uniref:Uncharacterized protein n=1 Tax=Phanerochaete sordida TaxID=48140 RepID=A0A9P3LL17_9APHY|nr:hypothetical protein PsYK624_153470 [Phanerochaete sordida]